MLSMAQVSEKRHEKSDLTEYANFVSFQPMIHVAIVYGLCCQNHGSNCVQLQVKMNIVLLRKEQKYNSKQELEPKLRFLPKPCKIELATA